MDPNDRDRWRAHRRELLSDLMERHGVGAVLLRRPANFAWYTGGADNRVDHALAVGAAALVVRPEGEWVVTDAIEAPRMRAEQTPGIEVVEHPWPEDPGDLVRELAAGTLAADAPFAGAADVADDVAALRRVLDPDAVERLRAVGADTTAATAEAVAAVRAGTSELDVAAELLGALKGRGLFAPVLMVAADERIASFRHPVPVGATVRRRAMLVTCGERGGLYASVTGFAELDDPDTEVARRAAACEEILRRMREEATRPGRTLAEAFADCRRFYAEAGHPDEWRAHHQGGMAGYAAREVIATPSATAVIAPGQAFAWNPSIAGAKAEETFVLTERGPEVVAGIHYGG